MFLCGGVFNGLYVVFNVWIELSLVKGLDKNFDKKASVFSEILNENISWDVIRGNVYSERSENPFCVLRNLSFFTSIGSKIFTFLLM